MVNRGKDPAEEADHRRLDQKKMRSCIQTSNEKGLTEYEKVQAANIKRNSLVLSALDCPNFSTDKRVRKL